MRQYEKKEKTRNHWRCNTHTHTHTHTRHFYGIIGLISLIFAMIIIFAINLTTSNTYAEEVTIGGVKYTYTASRTELNITGTGNVTNDWQSNATLSNYKETITTIIIGKNISEIGEASFEGCTSVTKVTFNYGTNCTTIGKNAFKGCSSLTNIAAKTSDGKTTNNTIPKKVETIGESAFEGCTSLQKVILNGANKIGTNAFANCSSNLELTFAVETEYTIPESGVYEIKLNGGQGAKMDATNGRKILGQKGATVTGYIQLQEGNNLTLKAYAGGQGIKYGAFNDKSTISATSGKGGNGIGIYLGEVTAESKPISAAGGGGGGGGIGVCGADNEFHGGRYDGLDENGNVLNYDRYDENHKATGTTGMTGKKGSDDHPEQNGHVAATYYYGSGGGGGGYPYGGATEKRKMGLWWLLARFMLYRRNF